MSDSAALRAGEDDGLVSAAQAGDERAFEALTDRYRHEVRVHCYRMLGSFEDAEDLVQETLLRAWRKRASYQRRATFRAWLYKIATNACLDHLNRETRRAQRYAGPPLVGSGAGSPVPPVNVSWLQPYPDRLLEPASPPDTEPDAAAIGRETIELAFLVAIQHLPPRQRAVLILRDVLGWSTENVAEHLDTSVPSIKSALQRARATVREHLPARRDDWARGVEPSDDEKALLQRYVDAHENADFDVIAQLLAEDVALTMPPHPAWLVGRSALLQLTRQVYDPTSSRYHGRWRLVPTRANRQLAVANYVETPSAAPLPGAGTGAFTAQGLDVLRIEDGRVAAITTFEPRLFPLFDLPPTIG